MHAQLPQRYPTLCDPMDCSLPGSSVHEILQARILKWVAISFSKGSSRLKDWSQVSCVAGSLFTDWATREDPSLWGAAFKMMPPGVHALAWFPPICWVQVRPITSWLTSNKQNGAKEMACRFWGHTIKKTVPGTSLAVQWLGFQVLIHGRMVLIPGRGTKIPHATWSGQKIKIK